MDLKFFRDQNIRFVFLDDEEFYSGFDVKDFWNNCFIEVRISQTFINRVFALSKSKHKTQLRFTERELEVLHYLVLGLTNGQISEKLNITVHTTKAHIHNIYEKLAVQSRTDAVVKAMQEDIISFK